MELTIMSMLDLVLVVMAWVFCCYVYGKNTMLYVKNDILMERAFHIPVIYGLLFGYSVLSPLFITVPALYWLNFFVFAFAVGTFISNMNQKPRTKKNG